ncbi:MAG: hypothetical protein AB1568_14340, partial [Thermodesulfobacteriota bacterium]
YQQRMEADERALGSLFFACADEMADITLLEAFDRILTLAQDNIRQLGEFAEDAVRKIIDAVVIAASHVLKPMPGKALISTH